MVPSGRTPATLHDVARAAAVHVSIASRVLNGTALVPIRAQTRAPDPARGTPVGVPAERYRHCSASVHDRSPWTIGTDAAGYDDDALAQFLEVPMTAIRMPLNELGSTAVDA